MSKLLKTKNIKRKIRHQRLRKRIFGTNSRPRLSVFRSNRYLYVQLINDKKSATLISFYEKKLAKEKKTSGHKQEIPKELKGKVRIAYLIGLKIAQLAQEAGIKRVVFDRGGYKYHGRVKALAEGARAGGLEF